MYKLVMLNIMKNLLNKYLILALSMVVITACSDDNDPVPNMPDTPQTPVSLSVFDDASFVSVPNSMIQSGDVKASTAAAYVTAANGFLLFNAFFTPPAGLQPSSKKISAANGRATVDFTVYEWTDGTGNGIAYQYSSQNGKHVSEVFVKSNGADYLKFIHAEEDENGSQGTIRFLDVDGSNPSEVAIVYTWSVSSNGARNLIFEDTQGAMKIDINSNPDLSGDMSAYEDGSLAVSYTWDGAGNGSWIEYNADGSIADQGSWTV